MSSRKSSASPAKRSSRNSTSSGSSSRAHRRPSRRRSSVNSVTPSRPVPHQRQPRPAAQQPTATRPAAAPPTVFRLRIARAVPWPVPVRRRPPARPPVSHPAPRGCPQALPAPRPPGRQHRCRSWASLRPLRRQSPTDRRRSFPIGRRRRRHLRSRRVQRRLPHPAPSRLPRPARRSPLHPRPDRLQPSRPTGLPPTGRPPLLPAQAHRPGRPARKAACRVPLGRPGWATTRSASTPRAMRRLAPAACRALRVPRRPPPARALAVPQESVAHVRRRAPVQVCPAAVLVPVLRVAVRRPLVARPGPVPVPVPAAIAAAPAGLLPAAVIAAVPVAHPVVHRPVAAEADPEPAVVDEGAPLPVPSAVRVDRSARVASPRSSAARNSTTCRRRRSVA